MTKEELRDYVDEQRTLNNIPYHVYSALIDGIDTLEQESCENSQDFGKWIKHDHADEYNGYLIPNYECSCCHMWFRDKTNYCPSCGILMKDGED